MFGYIKPFKPELKIREYETYKAVYCGLCEQLGQSFGWFARLTLSYDFTFLSMLHASLSGADQDYKTRRCCVNPLKTVRMSCGGPARRFSADIAALMIYYKLLDNIQDSGPIRALGWKLLRPFARRARKRAADAQPEADRLIAESMERQKRVEQRRSPSTDEASEPTALAMQGICAMLSDDPDQIRVLERLGYLIGRYVYLCDALDDAEEDRRKGNYNPLVLKYGTEDGQAWERLAAEAKQSLYLTAGEIGKALGLLRLTSYQSIIHNVADMGLRAGVEEILSKKEKAHGRPL